MMYNFIRSILLIFLLAIWKNHTDGQSSNLKTNNHDLFLPSPDHQPYLSRRGKNEYIFNTNYKNIFRKCGFNKINLNSSYLDNSEFSKTQLFDIKANLRKII